MDFKADSNDELKPLRKETQTMISKQLITQFEHCQTSGFGSGPILTNKNPYIPRKKKCYLIFKIK